MKCKIGASLYHILLVCSLISHPACSASDAKRNIMRKAQQREIRADMRSKICILQHQANIHPLQCPMCSLTFAKAHTVANHYLKFHLQIDEYTCKGCNEKFTKWQIFDAHKCSTHEHAEVRSTNCKRSADEALQAHETDTSDTQETEPASKRYKTTVPKKKASKGSSARASLKTEYESLQASHPMQTQRIKGEVRNKIIEMQQQNQISKFECPICGKFFKTPYTLTTHWLMIHSMDQFTCEGCQTSFTKWLEFSRHSCFINKEGASKKSAPESSTHSKMHATHGFTSGKDTEPSKKLMALTAAEQSAPSQMSNPAPSISHAQPRQEFKAPAQSSEHQAPPSSSVASASTLPVQLDLLAHLNPADASRFW